jgi:hypothetical protein
MSTTEEAEDDMPQKEEADYDMSKKEEAGVDPFVTAEGGQRRNNKLKYIICGAVVAVLLIILIIVLLVIPGHVDSPPYVPDHIDFSTGVSLVTYYGIEAKVQSRLATTKITVEVANAMDCTSVHVVTLHLPINTRVASLQTVSDDDCASSGVVQELEEARETFQEQAEAALSTAYVEVQDSFLYSLQVSIPPFGVTVVEMVVEQLLQQRLGEVKFEIPLIPNEEVDTVVLDLTVEDVTGNEAAFTLSGLNLADFMNITFTGDNDNNTTSIPSKLHLDIQDARQHDLPQVVRGSYNPGEIPAKGLLHIEGDCFEHFFKPSLLEPIPRNFIFLLDTSSSMSDGSKFDATVTGLSNFIDTLTPKDTFTIQTFAQEGTIELWGSAPGTSAEKEDAKDFLKSLETDSYGGTNLQEAILESLLRAKSNTVVSRDDTASILVLISKMYATVGEMDRRRIAETVFELNQKEDTAPVKIFPLGFQDNADMELLDVIAWMNGGVTASLAWGDVDMTTQITNFLESEVGNVILSDVSVELKGANVYGETQKVFPLLVHGGEVVVRGLLQQPEGNKEDVTLQAVTLASSMDGTKKWDATAEVDFDTTNKSSLCFHSYAHARITHLLRLYDATNLLGEDNELIKKLVTLKEDCKKDQSLADCIKAEALQLALDANVVVEGLTAMVTIDDEKCMSLDEEAEVCIDGTTPGDSPWHDEAAPGVAYSSSKNWSSAANSFAASLFVFVAWLFLLVALLF